MPVRFFASQSVCLWLHTTRCEEQETEAKNKFVLWQLGRLCNCTPTPQPV